MGAMTNSPYSGAGWVFRPGRQRGFREIALQPDGIAFGFCDLGDLSALPRQRTAFRRVVTEAYVDVPPSQFPVLISQFHWFATGMSVADLVAMVDERRSCLYLGRVCGPYVYSPADAPLVNRREVLWTCMYPLIQVPAECREHWRARTGLIPMGKIFGQMSALEGDSLIRTSGNQAG